MTVDLERRRAAIASALRLVAAGAAPTLAPTALPAVTEPVDPGAALAEAVAHAVRTAMAPVTGRFDALDQRLATVEDSLRAAHDRDVELRRLLDDSREQLVESRVQLAESQQRLDSLGERVERAELALPDDEQPLPVDGEMAVPPHQPVGRMSASAARALFGS